jgi:Ca2+-binding EF-hand superfamily protein
MKTVLALTALALASAATLSIASPEGGKADRGAAMHERLKAADTNGDGMISRAEAAALPRINQRFDQIDANKDGQVTAEELHAFHAAHAKHRGAAMFKHLDKDGDGRISKAEATGTRFAERFDQADANKDGFVTTEEMKAARGAHHRTAKAGQ